MKHLVLTLISVFVFVSCGNNKSITETDPETGYKYEQLKEEYNKPHEKLGRYLTISEVNFILDKQKVHRNYIENSEKVRGVIEYTGFPGDVPDMPFRITRKSIDSDGNVYYIKVQNMVTGFSYGFSNWNNNSDDLSPYFSERLRLLMFEDFNKYDVGEEFTTKSVMTGSQGYFPISKSADEELKMGAK